MTSKTNAANARILAYSYDADGRLTNRWSLEKGNTAYKYDNVGNLTNVVYAISPALTYSYDAANRLTSMSDSVGTTSFAYTDSNLLQSEDGPWDHDTVSYSYSARRRATMSLQQPTAASWLQTYTYDDAERISTITSPAGTFTYTYNSGLNSLTTSSALVQKLLLPNAAYKTNDFDGLARVSSITLRNSSDAYVDYSGCFYDSHNRRVESPHGKDPDTATDNLYEYDGIGQLVYDGALESDGNTPRWNETLSYSYDHGGNLQYRTKYTVTENFQVNNLNELTTQTNGGNITVIGTTTSTATSVTVNGTDADVYADATFAATNMARVSSYTAIAQDSKGRRDTNIVNVNIATNILFSYDGNGNMLSDGQHTYEWNDENELTAIYVTNTWRSEFVYDGKLRRRIEKDFKWNGSSWTQTNEVHFVYDGNLPIQHRDGNNHPTLTLTRGKDLSGGLDGAGGIGGLLAMTEPSTLNPQLSTSFYHSDANGNVTMLINTAQSVVAKYLYDAFGNTLSISGVKALVNPYRFSSMPVHELSMMYHYVYRCYSPELQRWLSCDPVIERGFLSIFQVATHQLIISGFENPYVFVNNTPTGESDPEGLSPGRWPVHTNYPLVPFPPRYLCITIKDKNGNYTMVCNPTPPPKPVPNPPPDICPATNLPTQLGPKGGWDPPDIGHYPRWWQTNGL